MSNHQGSYLLNEVIGILDEASVFDLLGQERSQALILKILHHALRDYDCNAGEILEGHEARFGICSYCKSPAEEIQDGLCAACRKSLGR